MRKSAILFAFLFAFTLSVSAQKARNDIKANITLAGSNYLAYPGPQSSLLRLLLVTNRSILVTMAAMARAML